MIPRQLVVGPAEHGVVRYARELAAAVRRLAPAATATEIDLPALLLLLASEKASEPRHLHVTDRLLGQHPQQAAALVEALAERAPLSVTLHDLPQRSDGARSLPRRAAAYRRVVAAARGVAVNSAHEAELLSEFVWPHRAVDAAIIPLPVISPEGVLTAGVDAAEFTSEVGLIGFVYPGKGHREVISAVAGYCDSEGQRERERQQGLPASGQPEGKRSTLGITALGAASAGHEVEATELTVYARSVGTRFTLTGYLDDEELLHRTRSVAVPIAAHQHVSASGSVSSWLAAGRRPLVPDTRYFREMLALRPGTLTLYQPDAAGLASALAAALRHPQSTLLGPGISTAPHLPETAAAYLRWWATGVRW